MSEQEFVATLRALSNELDEMIVGCDEIDAHLDAVLARSSEVI